MSATDYEKCVCAIGGDEAYRVIPNPSCPVHGSALPPVSPQVPDDILRAIGHYGQTLRSFVSEAHVTAAYEELVESVRAALRDGPPGEPTIILTEQRNEFQGFGLTERDTPEAQAVIQAAMDFWAYRRGWGTAK